MPRVAKIIDRMKPEHELEYYNAWLLAAGELEPSKFETFLKQYAEHLEQIEKLQAEKPKVYEQGSHEQGELTNSFMGMYMAYPIQVQRLSMFDLAMRDSTVIANRQILQYSIAAFI